MENNRWGRDASRPHRDIITKIFNKIQTPDEYSPSGA
jgi:hypothetical protein